MLGMELIVFKPEWTFKVLPVLVLYSAYSGIKTGKNSFFGIISGLFVFSAAALLYLITILAERQIFIALASFMHYLGIMGSVRLGKYERDQSALAMNNAFVFTAVFFAYAAAYGFYLNILVPPYYLMLVYVMVTLAASWQCLALIRPDVKRSVLTYSLLLSLVMAEIIWVMNFWPFGYLTTGVIALILFYVLWDAVRCHFLEILSKERIRANTAHRRSL